MCVAMKPQGPWQAGFEKYPQSLDEKPDFPSGHLIPLRFFNDFITVMGSGQFDL